MSAGGYIGIRTLEAVSVSRPIWSNLEETKNMNNNENTQQPMQHTQGNGYLPAQQMYAEQVVQTQGFEQPMSHQTQQSQWHERIVAQKPENKFKPNMTDLIFALISFVLGYIFVRWVFFSWQGWGVTAFTTAYLLTVTAYLIRKGAFVKSGAAIFWLAVTWLIGASYSLWLNQGFGAVRSLFLFSCAVYYVVVASGNTLMGRTSNFLLIDGINATIIIPFRNFINQYVSFSALSKGEKRVKILPTLLGIIVAVILASIIIPLLETADAGGFGMVLGFLRPEFGSDFFDMLMYAFFAIPVAAYLYGLISGAVHKKGTDIIKRESVEKIVVAMRILQSTTINIVLGAICVLYLVFIFSQLPYFFSAFTGVRPEGWLNYAQFARQGFFELVTIAGINLAILTISNLFSKKHRMDSRLLKIFNIALALITLVLIATAFSKMALYIGVYGLTMRRLLPCVFMVFMAIVFVALIALQKWDFSIVRMALVVGAIMIAGLSLSNPDAMVVRYNANRYLAGTLSEFDLEILRRAGFAGVLPAIEVYENTDDERLKWNLQWFLAVHNTTRVGDRAHRVSFEAQRAVNAVNERGFLPPAPMPTPVSNTSG